MSVGKIRVVIDTQVFLRAAANLKSLPAKVIFDLRSDYQLIVSEEIVAEICDVLYRPKIRAKFPHLTDKLAEQIIQLTLRSSPLSTPSPLAALASLPRFQGRARTQVRVLAPLPEVGEGTGVGSEKAVCVTSVIQVLLAAEQVILEEITEVSRDPNDDVFLACAKAAGANYLVSEDNDLLVLNPYGTIAIVNVLDFFHAIQPSSQSQEDVTPSGEPE